MNAIAFSLFGTSNLYVNGMIRNAELAKTVYPGWKVVVYADTDVPKVALHKLSKLGVDLRKPIASIPNQMFWRFCIADDPKVERFIVRDSDSRINRREAAAVTEWIDSDLNIHTLRDHPHHWLPIGGGMWGAKTGIFKPSMESLITASSLATNKYTRASATAWIKLSSRSRCGQLTRTAAFNMTPATVTSTPTLETTPPAPTATAS
jgi:hypothetical protein